MSQRENETPVDTSADISNPRDVQGILAILVTVGLLVVIGFSMFKAGTLQDALAVVNVLAPLAALILGFYFGAKQALAHSA
jgi:uncharacterized membrane protein YkgB